MLRTQLRSPKLRQTSAGRMPTVWSSTEGQEYAWARVVNVEWDPAKNRADFRKHGVNFEQVKDVFADSARIDEFNDRGYGEVGWIVIGMVGSVVVHVVYTFQNGDARLISARKAATHEQARYFSGTPWG